MGLISRVSSRTYRDTSSRMMIKTKLGIFEKEAISIIQEGYSVDKYEDADQGNQSSSNTPRGSSIPELTSRGTDTIEELSQDLNTSNVSNSDDANSGSEEDEDIIKCTRCNIPLPVDLSERRKHYQTKE